MYVTATSTGTPDTYVQQLLLYCTVVLASRVRCTPFLYFTLALGSGYCTVQCTGHLQNNSTGVLTNLRYESLGIPILD
jgi:hypothetical protein